MKVLIIVSLSIIGLFAGAIVGDLLGGTGGTSALIGLLLGLVGGILLARQTYPPKRRPPIDPGRYPNRVIRRDERGGS